LPELLFFNVPQAAQGCEFDLRKMASSLGVADLEGFRWALCAVLSRAFSHEVMVPFVDSCNHSFDPTCIVTRKSDGGFEFVASRDIRADEELTYDYCPNTTLTNDQLLFGYGFVIPGNSCDVAYVPLSLETVLDARARVELNADTALVAEGPCLLMDMHRLPVEYGQVWQDAIGDELWFVVRAAVATTESELESPAVCEVALLVLDALLSEILQRCSSTPQQVLGHIRPNSLQSQTIASYVKSKLQLLNSARHAINTNTLQVVSALLFGGRRVATPVICATRSEPVKCTT